MLDLRKQGVFGRNVIINTGFFCCALCIFYNSELNSFLFKASFCLFSFPLVPAAQPKCHNFPGTLLTQSEHLTC